MGGKILTDKQEREIRAKFTGENGEIKRTARKYHVSEGVISRVVRGLPRASSPDARMFVNLSSELLDAVHRRAGERGMSVSWYIRDLIRKDLAANEQAEG